MSLFHLITHKVKPPKREPIVCDEELDPKLRDHPLLQHANYTGGFYIIIGKPGSGKTTLWASMISSKDMLAKVFDVVFIIMPLDSFSSFGKDCKVRQLPEEQIFHELTASVLEQIEETVKENMDKEWKTLLIIDDMQQHLKKMSIQLIFNRLVANRRHKKLTIMVAAQTYHRIPREVRLMGSDLFSFQPTAAEQADIKEELVDLSKAQFAEVMNRYKKYIKTSQRKAFLYYSVPKLKTFIDWGNQLEEKDPLDGLEANSSIPIGNG